MARRAARECACIPRRINKRECAQHDGRGTHAAEAVPDGCADSVVAVRSDVVAVRRSSSSSSGGAGARGAAAAVADAPVCGRRNNTNGDGARWCGRNADGGERPQQRGRHGDAVPEHVVLGRYAEARPPFFPHSC